LAGRNTNGALVNAGNSAWYMAAPFMSTQFPPIEFNAVESESRVLNGVREAIGLIGQDVAVENWSENYWIRTA